LRHTLLPAILVAVTVMPCFAKDYLTITSDPAGATVEVNGTVVGKTPYTIEVPKAYYHGCGNVFCLKHALAEQFHVRILLDGYLPKEQDLARGPYKWIALNGTYHGDYFLLRTAAFNFTLEKAATAFTGNVQATLSNSGPATMRPTLPPEEIFRRANPAVLMLSGTEGHGSGFLVSDTGIAVTNAHVARGQANLTATTGNGQTFNVKVEYIDPNLDIALVKVEGSNFPSLPLADLSIIHVGSSVVALGSPSQGFQNSLTKGIVSAIGAMPNEQGTWIQTDAAINPGNSGGPLLDASGQVIGITTQKPFVSADGRPLQGIGFALSGSDLLGVLRRFYPSITPGAPAVKADSREEGKGKVTLTSDVDNAEIWIDDNFVGNVPSTLILMAGNHKVEIKTSTGKAWQRDVHVLPDSDVSLKATLKAN
jgi:S1-C subfamily serine protease